MREGYNIDKSDWFKVSPAQLASITDGRIATIIEGREGTTRDKMMLQRLIDKGKFPTHFKFHWVIHAQIHKLNSAGKRNKSDASVLLVLLCRAWDSEPVMYAKRHNNSQHFYFEW